MRSLALAAGLWVGSVGMLVAQRDAGGARAVSLASETGAAGETGAAVNAQFAACAGAPCVVKLMPAKAYAVRTTIVVPAAMGQVLDCQGTTLVWTGQGDEVEVLGLNGDSPSGEIRNCTPQLARGNAAGRDGVHQQSRIWMTYTHDTFQDWTNAGSAGSRSTTRGEMGGRDITSGHIFKT